MIAFARTVRVLGAALAARVFSAVTAEVGAAHGTRWQYHGGRLAFDDSAAPVAPDTIFDLASLTKVLATTTLALEHVFHGRLDLDARVAVYLPAWSAPDRRAVTLRDLFEHCSGLPAYRPYYREHEGRAAFEAAISGEPLAYAPRSQVVYSDPGVILAGFVIEDAGHAPLDQQFRQWRDAVGMTEPLAYRPPVEWRPRIACTEHDPWRGRVLQGEVHDENAAALGGVAAHAGLFGTVRAVGVVAQWWLRRLRGADDAATGIPATLAQRFVTPSTVPGSSRAVGWDTMRPTSSCGARLSPAAVGHTGFTGTSLWLDPVRDLYAALLTNRVHPSRDHDRIQPVRRAFHDATVADLEDGAGDCPS